MEYSDFQEIRIDPPHPLLTKCLRFVKLSCIVAFFLAVMAAAVWFFVFCHSGPRWFDVLTARSESAPVAPASHASVELFLSDQAVVLSQGDVLAIKAFVKSKSSLPVSPDSISVRWVSECPEVVQIDRTGKITALAPGSGFVKAVVSNRAINANAAKCLVSVRDNSSVAADPGLVDGVEVFSGAAVLDAKSRTIVFRESKKVVLQSHRGHSITMRRGDCITDLRLSADSSAIVSGRFVKGSNSHSFKNIYVPLH